MFCSTDLSIRRYFIKEKTILLNLIGHHSNRPNISYFLILELIDTLMVQITLILPKKCLFNKAS